LKWAFRLNNQLVVLRYEHEKPQRIDKFLATRLPELSRSRLQSLIKDGLVTVDGEKARKGGQLISINNTVAITIPPKIQSELIPEEYPLDIVFENEDLLVINKPPGMVVHPSAGHSSGTLVHAVLAHAPDIEGVGRENRPGVVHRLDKDTSGLILVAKNDNTHRWLQNQFKTRQVIKTYLALVDGKPPTPQGRVEAPIGREPNQRKKMAIVSPDKGRLATSEYQTMRVYANHTLLEVYPITGRTHQIRLHLAFLGCPVVGDRVYGHRKPSLELDRQFLHATRLRILLPDEKEPRIFEAPISKDLAHILEELSK
jgi:23S rRNA pseudouridine1911/1915/1917 synthase